MINWLRQIMTLKQNYQKTIFLGEKAPATRADYLQADRAVNRVNGETGHIIILIGHKHIVG